MKWSTQCAQHKWVAHSVTHTLRESMTCWVPRCFTVYIDRKSLFFNIWNPWLRTHLNAEKFFPLFLSGTLQVVPFISLLQTLWNVAEQVILASQVKRASSISFRLHCLSHLLPSWNSEFSVKASANDDKQERVLRESSWALMPGKLFPNVKHIWKSKWVPRNNINGTFNDP